MSSGRKRQKRKKSRLKLANVKNYFVFVQNKNPDFRIFLNIRRAVREKEEKALHVTDEEKAQQEQIKQMQELLQLQVQIKQQNLAKQFEEEEAELIERAQTSGMGQAEISQLVQQQREKQETTKQDTFQNDNNLMQQQLQGMAYSFAMQNQQLQLQNDRVGQMGVQNVAAQQQMAQSGQYSALKKVVSDRPQFGDFWTFSE